MDVQKEVEKFLLECNINSKDIYELIMEKIKTFKTYKNKRIFLKLMIKKMKKELVSNLDETKENASDEQREIISNLTLETKKIEDVIKVYSKISKPDEKTLKVKKVIIEKIKTVETFNLKEKTEPDIYFDTSIDDIDEINLPELMNKYALFIKKYNSLNDKDKLEEYSKYLYDILVEYLYNNKIFPEFCHVLDALKIKINEYDKDDYERKVLKEILNKFKQIYKTYTSNSNVQNNEIVFFEIIDYYLTQENYFSIQNLIKRKPEICNIKNEEGHISLHILNKYIENFKTMVEDKNSNYINLQYLKEIYELFTKSPSSRIKYEDKEKIDITINNFYIYIKSTIIKRSRKNFALEEAKSMKSCNFYRSKEPYFEYNFTDDNITYEKQRIINQAKNYVIRKPATTSAFVIGNTAYSMSQNESSVILNIHSLDITPFVKRKSLMNMYFEKCEVENEPVDDFILKGFKYEKGKRYPVVTYKLEFFISGMFKELHIEKDLINVTKVYNTVYNLDKEHVGFYDFYTKSVKKNGGKITTFDTYKINQHFESVLIPAYIAFIKRYLLPFIYKGYKKQTEKELEETRNFLVTKFKKMDKANMLEYLDILTSKIDRNHYSQYAIENPVYDLELIQSLNFLGLENQRMLNDLYFNNRQIENPKDLLDLKKEYYQRNDNIVNQLNIEIDYVDTENINRYRGKRHIKRTF